MKFGDRMKSKALYNQLDTVIVNINPSFMCIPLQKSKLEITYESCFLINGSRI